MRFKILRSYPVVLFCLYPFVIPAQENCIEQGEKEKKEEKILSILNYYENQIKKDPKNPKLLQALGDAYYSIRHYNDSIIAYQKVLDIEPNNNVVKIDLANSYLANGNEPKSRELFLDVLNSDPKNSQALAGLGRLEALLGHFAEAEQLYKHSLNIDPENETTQFYMAELLIDKKQYQEAENVLNELLSKKPQAEWIKEALTRAQLGPAIEKIKSIEESGNLAEALREYNDLLKLHPDVVEVYILLSQVYDKMGKNFQAKEILDQGLDKFPRSDRLKLAKGVSYIRSQDYENAEKIFNEIAEKTFLRTEAYAYLGRIYTLKGNFAKAKDYFDKALKIKPDNILTLSFLAELNIEMEDTENAEKVYKKILTIQPDLKFAQEALFNLKVLPYEKEVLEKIKLRDFKGAEAIYKNLVSKQPGNPLIYIKIGSFYEGIKQYNKAVAMYELGLSIFPDNSPMSLGLANAYFQNGQYQQSIDVYSKILEETPTSIPALLGLGNNEQALGNVDKAKAYFQKVLQMNSANQEALGDLGLLALKNKEYSEAEKIFTQLYELSHQEAWVNQFLMRAQLGPRFDEALELEKQKKIPEAIDLVNKLLKVEPKNVDLYILLGRLYSQQKDYKKAVEVYYEGLIKVPNDIQLRTAIAFSMIEEKEFDSSRRLLDFILLQDPFNAEALLGLGMIALKTDDREKAENYFQQAYALDPKNLTILSTLADYYLKNHQFDLAKKYFEEISKEYPNETWAADLERRAELGPLLLQIQKEKDAFNVDEVKRLYEKLIAETNESDKLEFILKYGQFLESNEEYDKALFLYIEALQLYPTSLPLMDALGFVYIGKGDFKTAKDIFQKSLKADPTDGEAMSGLGRIAEKQGDFGTAVENYLKALKQNPENLTALTFLAALEDKEGNFDQAATYYQKILEIDPTAAWAEKALKDTKYGPILAQIKQKELQNDQQGIQSLFQRLIIESCGDPEYFYQLGNYYQRAKKYELAVDIYSQGLQLDPKSDMLHASLGLSYISLKKWDLARKSFQKALTINPLNPDALAGLGNVETELGNLEEANRLIEKSMKIDHQNPSTLSSLGILRMKEKKYPEAAAAFKKITDLDPKAKWANILYENAINGKMLDELKEQFKAKNFQAAARGYEQLISRYPENPTYFFGAGLAYLRLQKYGNAAEIFARGVKLHPEENELLVSLGYAYLFLEQYGQAMMALQKALRVDPKNAEAIAGVGRVNALEKNVCYAEDLFLQAMEIDPKNQSALTFYGDLLMKEKRYQEAYEIFIKVKSLLVEDETWIEEALHDAQDGPLKDVAEQLSNQELFEQAACIYQQLINNYPQSAIRYAPLGQTYLDLFQNCRAISIFERGLTIDPDRAALWRGIATAYIQMEYYDCAMEILTVLVENDPKDADSWALIGRIEALTCSYASAEFYLCHALSISPDNIKALSYLADLRAEEQYFFSATCLFAELLINNPCPKWIRVGYNNMLRESRPTIQYKFYDHQEYEWGQNVGKWIANYGVLGGEIKIRFPVCDTFYSELILAADYYKLRDLNIGSLLYSLDAERIKVRGKWVWNPNLYLESGLRMTLYSRFQECFYDVQEGIYFEPELKLTYHRPREIATIGIFSDSDLVARNFNTLQAKLLVRYGLDVTYETEVMRRLWAGTEGQVAVYNAYQTNGFGLLLGWLRFRPDFCPKNLIFSYQLKFSGFTKNIPDYYTYYAQIVNFIQVKHEKYWRVLWADSFYTSFNLGIGEQNTYTKFRDIIVVNPTPADQSLHWDNRLYVVAGGKVEYTCSCIKAGTSLDLYRDSEKYTMFTLEAFVQYRF